MLANLSHEERLKLISLHTILGYKCIVLGICLLILLLVLAPMVSWETMDDPKVVFLAGLVGVGIASSIVLVVAESPRQFEQARRIQSIDQDLLETMTSDTENDDSDDRFRVVGEVSDVSDTSSDSIEEQV